MANFSIVQTRDQALLNIPRINYKKSQTAIILCQFGCNLEFNFSNIQNASLYNDGNFFTITPDGSNNYINWAGSNINGQEKIRFDLKEISFFAPTKDIIISDINNNYKNTIQYYFTFVNSNNTNIMIVASIIGKLNNTGSIQTNGYTLLNSLADQIPLNGDLISLSNLSNFNLGTLLPDNKTYYNTLTNNNTIHYLSLTNIVDIPINFFNNLISRVIGSTQAYERKITSYIQDPPQNPSNIIIFITEDKRPISASEAYVCNSNCDRVIGSASLLTPEIGKRTTVQGTPNTSPTSNIRLNNQPIKPQEEKCEEEEIWPGSVTNVRIKSAYGQNINNSNNPKITNNDIKSSMEQGTIITLFIIGMIIGIIAIFFVLCKKFNLSFFWGIFTRYFWDVQNIGWIILGLFAIIVLVFCLSFTLDIYIQQFKIENIPDEDKTPMDKIIEKKKAYIPLIIGLSVYIIVFVILFRKAWDNIGSSYGSSYYQNDPYGSFGSYGSSSFESSLPISDFSDPKMSQFAKSISAIESFTTQYPSRSNIFSTPQAKNAYKGAVKAFNNLSPSQQLSVKKYFGNQFFNPSSNFGKQISGVDIFNPQYAKSYIDPISNFLTKPRIIIQRLVDQIGEYLRMNPSDQALSKIYSNIRTKVGSPLSPEYYKVLAKYPF